MPALEIRPEEVGVYDYARHKAIRAKLWAKPAVVPPPILEEPAPMVTKQTEASQPVRSFFDYLAKDRTFDNSTQPKPRPRPIRVPEIISIVCEV